MIETVLDDSMGAVSFADEIRRVAAVLGRTPTDRQVTDLEALARSRSYIDEAAGRVVMHDGTDLSAFLARETAGFDLTASKSSSTAPEYVKLTTGNNTSYRLKNDGAVRITTSLQAAQAAATAREIATWGNPWRAGHENRTRQNVIRNTNPALAAKLKAEAGA